MADQQQMDSDLLVARQSAHYERWRRLHSPSPLSLPSEMRRMLPESPQAIPSLLESAANNAALDSSPMRSLRSTAATLSRAKSNDVLLSLLQRQDPQLTAEALRVEQDAKNGGLLRPNLGLPFKEIPSGWHAGASSGCRCAGAFSRATGSAQPSITDVVCHNASLKFDSDTFVSQASEYVVLVATRSEAQQLIAEGRPPNWAADPEGLFTETFVCDPAGEPKRGVATDNLPAEFLLREKTAWRTNREFAALSDIVISIENYSETYLPELHDGIPDGLWMSFDYSLRECKETQFFIARSNGGINVDEGRSRVLWLPDRRGDDVGLLYVYASKSLRFAQTREVGREEVMVLNMMAPAILSMLMQQLAFDRPLELVSANANGATGASPPPGVPATVPPPSGSRASRSPAMVATGTASKGPISRK